MAASLIAFVIVYFFVFGAGTLFILSLMGHSPQPGETGPEDQQVTRTAGITPVHQTHGDTAMSPAE